ncbi:hypothetical protein COO60DRAFT_254419 [Scenedesmus sp. NREL 46B-D3]|nr:hypothetical protein COO60DRAFT_254419 [Scenedesmus sp. NREL 46B-D3]
MSGPYSMGLAQPIGVLQDDKENLNPCGQQQPLHGLPGIGQQPGAQLLKAPARPSSSSVPKGRTPLADITKLCVGPVSAALAAAAAAQRPRTLQLPPTSLAAVSRTQCPLLRWSCPWPPCNNRYQKAFGAAAASQRTAQHQRVLMLAGAWRPCGDGSSARAWHAAGHPQGRCRHVHARENVEQQHTCCHADEQPSSTLGWRTATCSCC